jgi:hypothetical protein
MVLDGAGDEDDAVLKEARVDIEGAFAHRGLFDDHGDELVLDEGISRHDRIIPGLYRAVKVTIDRDAFS